jgi:REP element-mobilizing transposase RayT
MPAAFEGAHTRVMAYPRSMTVASDAPGFYHCISRCVRRAWLCGEDPVTGRNFDHRRAWIEQRLIELSESFAVGLYAWAVMSNHTHVVLRIDPTVTQTWSDEETARRWSRLSRTLEPEQPSHIEARVRRLLKQPQRLEEIGNPPPAQRTRRAFFGVRSRAPVCETASAPGRALRGR